MNATGAVAFPAGIGQEAGEKAQREFLTCRLESETYGIDILRVQEIREFDRLTRVPRVAPFVRGVINLRGAIVPIVDARACLGSGSGGAAPAVVIVLTIGRRTIGLAADAADEILEPGATRAQPPPAREQAAAGGAVPALVQALVPVGGRLLQLLDPAALLAALDGGQARAVP